MKKTLFLSLIASGCAEPVAADLLAADRAPPTPHENVLLIIGDDVGVDQIPSYGIGTHTKATMAAVDNLAAQGTRMTQAWANPVCTFASLVRTMARRVERRLRREEADEEVEDGQLSLWSATGRDLPEDGMRHGAGSRPDRRFEASYGYYSLDASRRVRADDRDGLQRLCRYVLRPAVSLDQLGEDDDGRVVVTLRQPWRDRGAAVHAGRARWASGGAGAAEGPAPGTVPWGAGAGGAVASAGGAASSGGGRARASDPVVGACRAYAWGRGAAVSLLSRADAGARAGAVGGRGVEGVAGPARDAVAVGPPGRAGPASGGCG